MRLYRSVDPVLDAPIRKKYGKHKNASFSYQHGFLNRGNPFILLCKEKKKINRQSIPRKNISNFQTQKFDITNSQRVVFKILTTYTVLRRGRLATLQERLLDIH